MVVDKEDAQRLMVEYEQHKAQIEALQEGIGLIDASLVQMDATIESLEGVTTLGKDNNVLLPVGSNSFLSARITDTKNAIVGIGADVAVKKTLKEAIAEVRERKKELEGVRGVRVEELNRVISAAQEMAPRLQEIMAKTEKEG
jgi:prefoldin alpha subunit